MFYIIMISFSYKFGFNSENIKHKNTNTTEQNHWRFIVLNQTLSALIIFLLSRTSSLHHTSLILPSCNNASLVIKNSHELNKMSGERKYKSAPSWGKSRHPCLWRLTLMWLPQTPVNQHFSRYFIFHAFRSRLRSFGLSCVRHDKRVKEH